MATTILGAIKDRFDTSGAGADTSTNGGLWVGEVPDQMNISSGPLAILEYSCTYEYRSESDKYAFPKLNFVLYAIGLAVVEALATRVMTAFELPGSTDCAAAFTIANGRMISMECTNYTTAVIGEREERDPNDNVPYEARLSFDGRATIPIGTL